MPWSIRQAKASPKR